MGHANSTPGYQELKPADEPKTNIDFETNANILQSTSVVSQKLDAIKSNGSLPHTSIITNGDTTMSIIPDVNDDDHTLCDLDMGSGEEDTEDDLDDLDELTRTIPTVFHWEHGGQEVFLSGSFSNWNAKIPLNFSSGEFETIIELPEGEHEFKYLVDGQWVHDPNLPTTNDTFGGRNNVVSIKKSDFEVMAALNSDDKRFVSPVASQRSTKGSYGQLIPSHHTPMTVKDSGIHSSVPPAVPPHLLNVNLNKKVPNVNEPSLLPEPNHVSVNHLYALSIKDGVMVVSSCIRYRKKFITTLLYRPVAMSKR